VHREGKLVEGREAEKRGVRKSGRKKRKGIGRNERGSKCTERIWRTYLQFMPPSSPTSWIRFCIMCAASTYVSKALWDMLLFDAVSSGTYGHIIALYYTYYTFIIIYLLLFFFIIPILHIIP